MIRVLVAVAAVLALSTPAHAAVRVGDTGPDVKRVQEHLKWMGYTVTVDSSFGPQTARAVRHFQKANGLEVDGIVGPITAAALGIRGEQQQITQPPAPPPGLTGCDEMRAYRIAAGLSEAFDAIGKRESNCQNDAKPTLAAAACCRGWWAIHKSNIRAPGYKAGAAACGITSEADYYGTTDAQKRASACFAKVLFDVSGMTPWRL